MKLSKNFSLAELTKSQTATRMGLDNNPSEDEQENLQKEEALGLGEPGTEERWGHWQDKRP